MEHNRNQGMEISVYVVTQGEYSDYLILGVFKHKKVAQDYAKEKAIKVHDTVRVEAWPLVETEFVQREEEVIKNLKLKEYNSKIIMTI